MQLKTMKGLALDDILAEVHTYVHRGKCGYIAIGFLTCRVQHL